MDKIITSLADYLGTSEKPAEPNGPRLEDISDSKTFALAVLDSHEFRSYVVSMLTLGEIPAAVLCRLMDYAWGKPVDHVEVVDKTVPVEHLTPDDLEERSARLAEMARFLRRADQFNEPVATDSVH